MIGAAVRDLALPGMERPKRLGGVGTPLVWEIYLVDHTGTRKLGNTQHATPISNLAIDVYADDPDVDISYEPRHLA